MSLWQRLRQALGAGKGGSEAPADAEQAPSAPAPGARLQSDETDGAEPAAPAEGAEELADDLLLQRLLQERAPERRPGGHLHAAVDRLWQAGRQRSAIEYLHRFHAAFPEDDDVLLRLGEALCLRGEHRQAIPLLCRLLALRPEPEERLLRARSLLSEAYEATGDAPAARAELEEVLAEDLDYPQARGRFARLPLAADAAGGREPGGLLHAAPAAAASREARELPTLLSAAGVRHQRYQLVRELGRGSAGAVYLAHDTELGRDLAIKLFHPQTRQSDRRAWAWNEARLTAAVRHPGVVAIYDLDDERHLVVMELCTGGTLRQRLQQAGRLPPAVALLRGRELLSTLELVHRTGVVHGDLKPGNLLFRGAGTSLLSEDPEEARYGDLVIADFGTARLLGAAAEGAGQAAGTLGYLAPERRRRPEDLSPAADLYAAGAILLEMLHGTLPLSRHSLLRGDPLPRTFSGPAAEELGPRRAPLEALLGRLLSEDPAARPAASEAQRLLELAARAG